jgi:DNA mismatch repair protein MutS2
MTRVRRGDIEGDARARLELPALLEEVARHGTSAPGRAALRRAEPAADREGILSLLQETAETIAWRESGATLRLADLTDLPAVLDPPSDQADRLLTGEELGSIGFVLERTLAIGSLLRAREDAPHLGRRGAALIDLPTLRESLERSVDRGGRLLDTASPLLGQARGKVERLQEDLRRWMEKHRDDRDLRRALQGSVISMRNGRWVFAVRAERRRSVPGVVHDRSTTGSTLYIEPQEIVLRGNELSDLRATVQREETRIFVELTREVRKLAPSILERWRELVALDCAWGRAGFGLSRGGVLPTLAEGRHLRLRGARHPLLMAREGEPEEAGAPFALERARERVVPLDLELTGGTFHLVVTGPNTGGKTVVLKTVGLAALMTYCGIPVPADAAEIPVFDSIFADIGDEQSIEQNLSTFGSHVTVLAAMLDRVSSRSLVLIDELGAGTDPLEGAALAEAILEDLYRRGAFSVVTTHLGRLKEYAYRHRKSENASMEFDPAALAPTYRLRMGLAGKSNALIIARRLGLPEAVIERARELQAGDATVDAALLDGIERTRSDLERRTREMERLRREAARVEEETTAMRSAVARRREAVEFEAEAAEEERVGALIDRIEAALRAVGEPPKERRDAWDELLRVLSEGRKGTRLAQRRDELARSLRKGDRVHVPQLGGVFVVRKINKAKERLTVDAHGIPAEVTFQQISWIHPPQDASD